LLNKWKNKKIVLFNLNLYIKHFQGEAIFITGNIPSLGNWSIENSERMITNNQDYPLWISKENIIARQNSEIQYKYLIFKDGKFVQWEKKENNANRKVKVGNDFRLVINDRGSTIEKFKEYPYPEIIHGASHPHASVYGIVVEKCKNSSIINIIIVIVVK
jgi:hypothetical protein